MIGVPLTFAINEKRLLLTITLVYANSYRRSSRMITIGKMPRKCKRFFRPARHRFHAQAWDHFWMLVLAISISHRATIDRLAKLLRGATHRTNHGEFLWRSDWDEGSVLREIALDTLRRLHQLPMRDPRCFLIIDDTQTLKRAKRMEGVGKLYHHATGTYGRGHTILKACLYINGVIIPWGSYVYVKKEHAPKLRVPFKTLTELAGEAIRDAQLPRWLKVTVLFDAYYLCPNVVSACADRRWHYIGVGKSNRNFMLQGNKKKLGVYGKNVLRRDGQWYEIKGLKSRHRYRLAERVGVLNGLGEVKVVFSRRRGERKSITLVTDDLRASMRQVVAYYLFRWAVELLIKDEKQNLGLGDYRVKRYRAVVRHLHLVDIAYACLTHLALDEQRAQGKEKTKQVLSIPPISQLKERMRQVVWREAVDEVVKVSHERAVIRRLERLKAAA
jgi:SRSO17 transposase